MMNKQVVIDTIKTVLEYEDHDHATGTFNVGQLAKTHVREMFSLRKGDSLTYAVEHANVKVLREVYDYLQKYIDHMLEYPVDKCPLCRALSRRENFRKNTFIVQFENNYIETLLTYVGPDKAIKRLLEEGAVSLKIELTKGVHAIADQMLQKIDTFVKEKETSGQS